MRYLILLTYDEKQAVPPDERLVNEMGMFNARLEKAGVLRGGEGLVASDHGARVTVTDEKRTVVDGPFTESKELVAGFWILDVSGLEEAVEWARRVPNPQPGRSATLEVRRVVEAEDLGDALSPGARAAEERMRARLAELD